MPASSTAQKDFRTGWIMLHQPGSLPTNGQLNKCVGILDQHMTDWRVSTTGLGSMDNTLPEGPILTQSPLVRGQQATLQVANALPGERVFFAHSRAGIGNGPCVGALGGLCLDLLSPIVRLGSSLAGGNGTALLNRNLPPNVPLVTIHTQAAIRRGPGGADSVKTNTVTDTIQP